MKKFLIVGASGFIGTNILNLLPTKIDLIIITTNKKKIIELIKKKKFFSNYHKKLQFYFS